MRNDWFTAIGIIAIIACIVFGSMWTRSAIKNHKLEREIEKLEQEITQVSETEVLVPATAFMGKFTYIINHPDVYAFSLNSYKNGSIYSHLTFEDDVTFNDIFATSQINFKFKSYTQMSEMMDVIIEKLD